MPRSTKCSGAGVWRPTEKQFQAAVVQLAQWNGWRTFHPWLSVHSAAGWPDLVLLRGPRLVCAELKRGGRKPTLLQQCWLNELAAVPGVESYCWHAGNWTEIEHVLARSRRRAPERKAG